MQVITNDEGMRLLAESRICAIVRHVEEKRLDPLMQAMYAGGIRVVEITMNTAGAERLIPVLLNRWGNRMWIGAGTVTGPERAERALHAGARFFVTPNVDPRVIRAAHAYEVPVFAGAMTPTEIVAAHAAGAAMVKVFPCGTLGAGYLKELQSPLSEIPMMAVGGVTPDNAAAYFRAGAAAVGVGSGLIRSDLLESGNYAEIERLAHVMVNAGDEARGCRR